MRPVPQAAIDLVKKSEGFRATCNLDPVGFVEIGYGHRLVGPDAAYLGATITEQQATSIALGDLSICATQIGVVLGVDVLAKLTDGQWAALLDFVYNEGIGSFQSSTLCRLIKAGDMDGAAAQFERWIYAGEPPVVMEGLVTRRAAEHALWTS